MRKKHWSILGLALGVLVLGVLVGLMTVNTVAADPTPGIKIQIPRIDVGDVFGTGDWETWIQVQNVGAVDTGAIFLGWGDYSGMCPTNDPGVIAHYCQLIRENALWTLKGQIDESVKSGIIYTVRADLYTAACSAAEETEHDTDAWRCWKEEWEYGTCEGKGGGWADPPGGQGEEVAVTVTRYGPNDYGTFVSSTYTGISEEMEGEDPPYNYYAPYIMKTYLNQLDTEMTIQNSGQDCTSVWIDYMEQGSCYTVYKEHIVQLAPGEAVRVKVPTVPPDLVCDWPGWLGSAHISAEQPLGIIVDQTSFEDTCVSQDRGTLLTYRARPKVEVRDSQVITDTFVYADLIFREWSGWESSIQVQNLSVTSQRTWVTVDFMDNSGDEILFLGDWVCPTGSTTFFLPAIQDLGFKFPFGYVGAAEIESHDQVAFPGGKTPAQPIFAVVDLKRADDPDTPWLDAQGGSYNAHPYSQKKWVSEIALPFMAKDTYDLGTSWTSMIAIRNNSNCNKIKPKIWFKDETGDLLCELQIPWLHPKHVKLIDLDDIGCLYPGYVGAAKVIIDPEEVEQLCDVDNNGHVDNEPIMPSVIVVEKNVFSGAHGDITNIYEGIPYAYKEKVCYGDIMGKVHSIDPCEDPGFDAAEPIWLPGQDPQGVTVSRVVLEEAPFSVFGYAYVGEDCGLLTLERLAGAYVELQVKYFDDPNKDGIGVWRWKVKQDTITNGDGYFEFEDTLELEDGEDPAVWEDGDEMAYRLTLSLQTNGTVSYTSGEFDDAGNWAVNFRIETVNGGLDITTGTWCDPLYVAPAVVERTWVAETNSTGDYEAEHVVAGKDLPVEFSMTDFLTYITSVDLDCGEDKVLDAELLCLGEVGIKVVTSIATDTNASIIAGAAVEYSKPYGDKAAHYGDYYRTSGTTDNTGVLTLTVPILNATGTFTVSAPGIAETGVFTWTQMVNTPTDRTTCANCGDSIFGGDSDVHNSRVLTPTGNMPDDLVNAYMWYGFEDGSCANVGSASRVLNNQDVELVLCGFGTVPGRVTVGGNPAAGRLVEVIMNGVVVGTDTTDASGNYIVEDIPTGCFSTDCTAVPNPFSVRVMGSTKNGDWEGCGDVERVDFPF